MKNMMALIDYKQKLQLNVTLQIQNALKLKQIKISTPQIITLTGALLPERLASSVEFIAVMLYCLVMDNLI